MRRSARRVGAIVAVTGAVVLTGCSSGPGSRDEPRGEPVVTVYAVVNKPKVGGSGAGTTCPVFRRIMAYLLQKYAVAPTGTLPPSIPTEWTSGQDLEVPSPGSLRAERTREDAADGTTGDTTGGTGVPSTTGTE